MNDIKNSFCSRGFTLTELMVVVVIVGILAAVSLPNYMATREKALDKEALAALKLIRAGERQYFAHYEIYVPANVGDVETDIATINTLLATDLQVANWHYSITGAPGGFSAEATRLGRTWTATQDPADPVCSGAPCY